MKTQNAGWNRYWTPAFLLALLVFVGCGDDDNGPDAEQTGTVLQGTVIEFQAQVVPGGFALAATEGVNVSIGAKSTQTDANGDFTLRDFAVGSQGVDFSRDGGGGTLILADVEPGDEYAFLFSINGGAVSTQHTGNWVGTGGSSDPSSQGQVALTMIIAQNGNSLTGTASIGDPDNTSWNITGTENGHTVNDGEMHVTSTTSDCASSVDFDGEFIADTLKGTFTEVHAADGSQDHCGANESGSFHVVKQ